MGNAISTMNHIAITDPEYPRLFPPVLQTPNKYLLQGGPLALFNSYFVISFQGLFQQLLFWGLFSGLVGFSTTRMMDLHYLCITFAITFLLLSVHFLSDIDLNSSKLIFFTQHVAIEFLIGIRVLAPPRIIRKWTGVIFFLVWLAVVSSTAVIVSNHAVYYAIVMASLSDGLMAITGVVLLLRKFTVRGRTSVQHSRRLTAEAISGLGLLCHGLSALPNTVIVVLILNYQDPASYFGMVWTGISLTGLLAAGLQLPVAGLFFSDIRCCCGRRRNVSPGQIDWEESMEHDPKVEAEESRTFERK
ncbi:unnamed protein product [Cercospora beticola]|nr:unnamed protein product [Cercospora beticola]